MNKEWVKFEKNNNRKLKTIILDPNYVIKEIDQTLYWESYYNDFFKRKPMIEVQYNDLVKKKEAELERICFCQVKTEPQRTRKLSHLLKKN